MSKCPDCGAELDEGARFCANCGASVPQVKKCPKCGMELSLQAKFCLGCGFQLDKDPAAGINMGDKNVIAGDVVAEKVDGDSFSGDKILGNVTHTTYNTTVTDETKSVNTCSICGVHMTNDTGHTCPKCSKPVCSDHFNAVLLCCKSCADKELMGSRERCRVCGRTLLPNQEFICRICHKTVCEKHYDDEMMCCKLCAMEQKKADEEEAARKAEAKRQAEAEARRQAEAEARRQAEAEARRQAEAEAKRQAEAEGRRQAELAAAQQAAVAQMFKTSETAQKNSRPAQQCNSETDPAKIRAEIRKFICERFSHYIDNTNLAKYKANLAAGLYIDGKTVKFKESKFTNALASYTSGITKDDIVILSDDTVFGSAKEGFIITVDGVFSKSLGSAANMVKFKDKPTVALDGSNVSILSGAGTNFRKETLCELMKEIVTTICENETWYSVLK
jgi:hypothetical protein